MNMKIALVMLFGGKSWTGVAHILLSAFDGLFWTSSGDWEWAEFCCVCSPPFSVVDTSWWWWVGREKPCPLHLLCKYHRFSALFSPIQYLHEAAEWAHPFPSGEVLSVHGWYPIMHFCPLSKLNSAVDVKSQCLEAMESGWGTIGFNLTLESLNGSSFLIGPVSSGTMLSLVLGVQTDNCSSCRSS